MLCMRNAKCTTKWPMNITLIIYLAWCDQVADTRNSICKTKKRFLQKITVRDHERACSGSHEPIFRPLSISGVSEARAYVWLKCGLSMASPGQWIKITPRGVLWVTWPHFEILGPLSISGVGEATGLKFGTRLNYGKSQLIDQNDPNRGVV